MPCQRPSSPVCNVLLSMHRGSSSNSSSRGQEHNRIAGMQGAMVSMKYA